MMHNWTRGIALLLALVATGCTFAARPYLSTGERPEALRTPASAGAKVNLVVTAPGGDSKPGLCHLSTTVELPDDQTYAPYLEQALRAELQTAGIQQDDAAGKVTVELRGVDFESILGSGLWRFHAMVINVQGTASEVYIRHPFGASFATWSACGSVARELVPATNKFAASVFKTQAFAEALVASARRS